MILAGRSMDKIKTAISNIRDAGYGENGLTPLHLDVTDHSSIQRAAADVDSQFGRLDILINNAGVAPEGPDTAAIFRATFETNVVAPALVSAAFRPLLLQSASTAGPYSIYMGSTTSSLQMLTDPSSYFHTTTAGSNAYRASKSALNMLAMHEQLEVADTPLRVRVMCPGFVVSNIRGTSEEARTAGGLAGDPRESALLVLSVIRGEREADAQGLITSQGVCPW